MPVKWLIEGLRLSLRSEMDGNCGRFQSKKMGKLHSRKSFHLIGAGNEPCNAPPGSMANGLQMNGLLLMKPLLTSDDGFNASQISSNLMALSVMSILPGDSGQGEWLSMRSHSSTVLRTTSPCQILLCLTVCSSITIIRWCFSLLWDYRGGEVAPEWPATPSRAGRMKLLPQYTN